MNINKTMWDYMRELVPDVEAVSTGGGCDYLVRRVGDLELVLSDAKDACSPYPEGEEDPVTEVQAIVVVYDMSHPENYEGGWRKSLTIDCENVAHAARVMLGINPQ